MKRVNADGGGFTTGAHLRYGAISYMMKTKEAHITRQKTGFLTACQASCVTISSGNDTKEIEAYDGSEDPTEFGSI